MINKRDNFKLRQEPLKSIKLREFFTKLWIFLNNVLILEVLDAEENQEEEGRLQDRFLLFLIEMDLIGIGYVHYDLHHQFV